MVDANQKWSVPQAIQWMKELAKFKLHWIEEPTSPDDILGHLEISKALKDDGIGVATGSSFPPYSKYLFQFSCAIF